MKRCISVIIGLFSIGLFTQLIKYRSDEKVKNKKKDNLIDTTSDTTSDTVANTYNQLTNDKELLEEEKNSNNMNIQDRHMKAEEHVKGVLDDIYECISDEPLNSDIVIDENITNEQDELLKILEEL